MIEDSFIKLPKEKVIELCEHTIKQIEESRRLRDDTFIRREMDRINKSWLRKLFRRPQITFEETKKLSIGYHEPFYFPSYHAYGALNAAERILRAAKASEDYVYVSSSDFLHIS